MVKRILSLVMTVVLCLGLTVPALAFSNVSPLIMSYEDDAILESKLEAVNGFGDEVWVEYAQAGRSIRLRQHPEFQGVIQTVWIVVVGSEDKVYYFQRGEGDTAPMGVLTVTFDSVKTVEGKTVDLSDPNETYVLTVQTQGASGSSYTDHLFFRTVDGGTASETDSGNKGNAATVPSKPAGANSNGDNVAWTFDEATGTLTINGIGPMKDYIHPDAVNCNIPWKSKWQSIKSVYIGEGITSIGAYTFSNCTNLVSISIPSSMTSIGDFAFMNCAFESFIIPKNVTYLGKAVFSGCSLLTAFSVESENTAFSSSDGILYDKTATTLISYPEAKATVFTIPQNVETVGEGAFYSNRSLTAVTISNGVTTIGEWAFYDCRALASLSISNTVTNIGNRAFQTCLSLTSVSIPSSVANIGEYAFSDDTKLASLVISNGVTSIGRGAFNRCLALTSVTIPSSVSSIGIGAFVECGSLTSIDVDSTNAAYTSLDGILYNKSKTTLIQCPAGKKGSLTIPNGVTRIEESAFETCSGLTSIMLPESVSSIGKAAFRRCFEVFNGGLTIVNIPNGVTRIEDDTFAVCASLDSITIPDSVTFIGEDVFDDRTTICGKIGGYAEKYAKEKGLKFSAVSTTTYTNIAYASTQSVNVDGKAVEFQMYALKDANGNYTNYVKLRDIATALDGTVIQFNVVWDGNVIIERGKPYTARNGQENKTPYSGDQPYTATVAAIKTGLTINNLAAFIITDSNGNGSTYCKLRDIGQLLNFKVDWSAERGVYIETTASYDGKGYRDISQGIGEDNPYYIPGIGIMPTYNLDGE